MVYFVQSETNLHGADSLTNQSLFEELRYHAYGDVFNGSRLVAELSLYKDPDELRRIGFPLSNFTQRHTPAQFVFATASNDGFYFHVSMDTIARIQTFFPNHSVYFYDLSDGILDGKVDKVKHIILYGKL